MRQLYVDSSHRHGRGVFAARPFAAGEVIEDCPVLVVPEEEWDSLAGTCLSAHVFAWEGGAALALGSTSLLNHSDSPNAVYEMDYDGLRLVVRALEPIPAGREITINYGGAPDARVELWFEAV